uniref:Small integral membrane protein 22 n=1 Tax=Pygocentrus nattereri TaxID=42514 RepID=A0AAR2KHK4_PYGNA
MTETLFYDSLEKILVLNSIHVMAQQDLQQDFQNQFNDVVSRLQSKQLFQSDWDIASFAIFFIFIGMVLLLVILVIIRCCCCCCCDEKVLKRFTKKKKGRKLCLGCKSCHYVSVDTCIIQSFRCKQRDSEWFGVKWFKPL